MVKQSVSVRNFLKTKYTFCIATYEGRNVILTLDIFMEGQEQIWKQNKKYILDY